MTFTALASGSSVFLDSNVFVYSYGGDPTFGNACTELRERIELNQLRGYISTHVFSEIAHRLMTLEACQTLGWSYAGVSRRLRRHPQEVQKLQKFRQALDDILAIGVHILPVEPSDVLKAADLCLQHGLLSSDALLLAMMQKNGLTQLASNDADFDRVPGIIRYGPV